MFYQAFGSETDDRQTFLTKCIVFKSRQTKFAPNKSIPGKT